MPKRTANAISPLNTSPNFAFAGRHFLRYAHLDGKRGNPCCDAWRPVTIASPKPDHCGLVDGQRLRRRHLGRDDGQAKTQYGLGAVPDVSLGTGVAVSVRPEVCSVCTVVAAMATLAQ